MSIKFRKLLVATVLLGCLTYTSANDEKKSYSLDDPATNIEAFIRMRGDTAAKDSLMHWNGSVFAVFKDEAPKRIFGFEGFNVSRMQKQADGSWRMLTREYAIYRDPATNAILNTWKNPYSKAMNIVFHVQNDPVNQTFGRKSPEGKTFPMPFIVQGPDVRMGFDALLAYPNPINVEKYPDVVGSKIYSGSEHFGFFGKLADFANTDLTSVPVQISWSRNSPWLPWMKMGKRPGTLMFSAWGRKVESFEDIAPDFKAHIEKAAPEYFTAPTEWTQPNATTWTEYRKQVLEAKK